MRDENPNLFISRELKKMINSGYEKKVCKIKYGIKNGTGFLCIIPSNGMKVLLTCNHVLDEDFVDKCKKKEKKEENEKSLELLFDVEEKKEKIYINLNIDRYRYIFTDKILDFTLIEILDEIDKINGENFLEVDENYNTQQYNEEEIYVPQFTKENENIDFSLGKIKGFKWPNFISDDKLQTDFGSSGSPIILKKNNKVIGLHIGKNSNKKKKRILLSIKSIINGIDSIICLYKNNEGKETIIINEIFYNKNLNSIKILINGKEEEKNYKYTFNETTENNYIYILKENPKDEEIDLSDMFSGCDRLYKINLSPLGNKKIKKISNIFNGCSSLEEVNLSYLNVGNLEDMSNMFNNCNNLKEIYIKFLHNSETGTKNVKNMSNMFQGCFSLKSLDLSSLDFDKIENLSNMFLGCSSLKEIHFPNEVYTNNNIEKNISHMFEGCSNLEEINESFFKYVKKIIDVESLFKGCSSLKKINLKPFNSSDVKNMGFMFSKCSKLEVIEFSDLFDTKKVIDMTNMFNECSSLINLNLSYFSFDKVQNLSKMFYGCSSLKSIEFKNPNSNIKSDNSINIKNISNMFNKCKSLEEINLSFLEKSKIKEMECLFNDCSSLQTIILPFDSSDVENMENIFSGCSKLEVIEFSDSFNTKKVTDMSNMFNECLSLISLDLSKFDTSNVIQMNSMFFKCMSLSIVNLSSFITLNVNNMSKMFENCHSIKNLNLSSFHTDKLNNCSNMFKGCKSLESLNISNFKISEKTNKENIFDEVPKSCNLICNDEILLREFNNTCCTSGWKPLPRLPGSPWTCI